MHTTRRWTEGSVSVFCGVVLLVMFGLAAVFAAQAQTLTTLLSFDWSGRNPTAPLVQGSDGNFYGTTAWGGPNGDGTVFRMTPGGALTTIHNFCSQQQCADGRHPYSGLVAGPDGNFYGTTEEGGAYAGGEVYRITPGGALTTVYSFCAQTSCPDGAGPYAGLVLAADGNFYGTTIGGGDPVGSGGTVFKLTRQGALTTLYRFCTQFGCPDGLAPYGGLTKSNDGNLYGTTFYGGTGGFCAGGCGTIFKISLSGAFATIHNFCRLENCADGEQPIAGLVQGGDGNLYGTTFFGGANDPSAGTVFKVTPSGTLTTLHSFCSQNNCGDGGNSEARLIQATDGSFYGTTSHRANLSSHCVTDGCGTIFKVTVGGIFTTLHTFAGYPNDGAVPYAALVQVSDGNFYGTTSEGGNQCREADGCGTVFRLSGPQFIPTTTTLTSTPNPSYLNQNVAMTATVHAQNGSTPSGRVLFESDGVVIGTVGLNRSGVAVLNYSALSVGTHRLVGVYEGGNGYGGSVSNAVSQVVTLHTSTTAVTSTPNPSAYGEPVTITATVGPSGPPVPTGTVRFTSNGSPIFNCGAVPLSSGQAVCNTTLLAPGTDAIVAAYSGDSYYSGSSGMVLQNVDSHFYSTTTVTSTPNPSTFGQQVTIMAMVASPSGGEPTGTASFTSNGAAIPGCTGVALVSEVANCVTSTLAVGTDSVVAMYSGDSVYAPSTGIEVQIVNPVPMPLGFVSVTPCRLVDTRQSQPIQGNTFQSFTIPQLGGCAIPPSAVAYSLNVTVVPHGRLGYLTIWPTGEGQPFVSTLNSSDGRVKANAAIVPAGANGAVSVYVTDTSDVILDIDGYFKTPSPQTYQFYPLPPCRVIDTRNPDGPLGGPYLHGGRNDGWHRDFPVRTSDCIPANANVAAYSLNVTVAPHVGGQRLGYLTVWPEGSDQPLVSTLNNPTATVVANAAMVPAGTDGGISVFAYDDTDMIADINGYFGPAGQGGYSFYPLTPCRANDSRDNNGQPFQGTKVVDIGGSPCAPPATARGYVFNATVVPDHGHRMGYLTLWPEGENMPLASTLNAYDGLVTSNMAIVPNDNGSIDAYADGLTHLILDISGYFAP